MSWLTLCTETMEVLDSYFQSRLPGINFLASIVTSEKPVKSTANYTLPTQIPIHQRQKVAVTKSKTLPCIS